jgi:L-threonylcarbamoyladenylate synthase
MSTEILTINRQMPEWEAVSAAARVIDSGGVICFPTDTVYGLAVSIYSADALARLRSLKSRCADDPFVVIASDLSVVRELATAVTAGHRKLIDAYWPGPLTIVFKASDLVPEGVLGQSRTIALRVPADVLTQSILRACGMPLAAPSANVKGRWPAVCPEDVLESFEGEIDLLLDGGLIESSEPSTIVAVGAGGLQILRPGRISPGKL